MKTFIRTGKLRRWLGKPGNPSGVRKVKKIFDKLYPTAFGSSDSNDINSDEGSSSDSDSNHEPNSGTFRPTSPLPAELIPLLRT